MATQAKGINAKLAQLQGNIIKNKVVFRKDAVNPFFKSPSRPNGSKYLSLDCLIETLNPLLNDAGLVLYGKTRMHESGVTMVSCHIVDVESGESIEAEAPISSIAGSGSNIAQSWGSAFTYLRRYLICLLLNIASEEDDDGNANTAKKAPQKPVQAPTANKPTQQGGNAPTVQSIAQLKKLNILINEKVGADKREVWINHHVYGRYSVESMTKLSSKQSSELIEKLTAKATMESGEKIHKGQLSDINDKVEWLNIDSDTFKINYLQMHKATSVNELTAKQAEQVIKLLDEEIGGEM